MPKPPTPPRGHRAPARTAQPRLAFQEPEPPRQTSWPAWTDQYTFASSDDVRFGIGPAPIKEVGGDLCA